MSVWVCISYGGLDSPGGHDRLIVEYAPTEDAALALLCTSIRNELGETGLCADALLRVMRRRRGVLFDNEESETTGACVWDLANGRFTSPTEGNWSCVFGTIKYPTMEEVCDEAKEED